MLVCQIDERDFFCSFWMVDKNLMWSHFVLLLSTTVELLRFVVSVKIMKNNRYNVRKSTYRATCKQQFSENIVKLFYIFEEVVVLGH